MNCGVGRRLSWDLALLWLWHWPAATTPIRPLAWEPSHASGAALKDKKRKKKKSPLVLATVTVPLGPCPVSTSRISTVDTMLST